MAIQLNSEEEYIAETQCRQCEHWSEILGCTHPRELGTQPIDDCEYYEEGT